MQGKICLTTIRLTGNSSVSKTDSTSALMTVTEDKKVVWCSGPNVKYSTSYVLNIPDPYSR